MMKKVGNFSSRIIQLLDLQIKVGTPIYIGETNIKHIKESHPEDYSTYYQHLSEIIAFPDYACINKKDKSIEFVKEFFPDQIKVAVRISTQGIFFVRSLYKLNERRVYNFIANNILKRV